ncbi:hypothetical protein ACFX43_04355 [Nocardioides sp. YIM B13467]|uniref:hypothetical protein n=1 Tax=Nocardioides sp. YIM B13467 TaxID=3366294 RepID=UPI00366C3644
MPTTSKLHEPPPEAVATGVDALEQMLRYSGRGYTVVRHIFLQLPDDVTDRAGLLGPMVTDRKRRSLQIYLLLLTIWPWLQRRQAEEGPLPNKAWARALQTETGRRWSATDVSNAWGDLEQRGLITRKHLSRGVEVTPRREDGKTEYTTPGGKKKDHRESYFILPGSFWRSGLFEKLSMPGLAMLLIIAGRTSESTEAWLTNKDAAKWYHIAPRSIEAGIENLRDHGLLLERVEWVKAPLSSIGATQKHWYSLTGQFSTEARNELRAQAQKEARARSASTKAVPTVSDGDNQTSDTAAEGVTATRTLKRRRKEKSGK